MGKSKSSLSAQSGDEGWKLKLLKFLKENTAFIAILVLLFGNGVVKGSWVKFYAHNAACISKKDNRLSYCQSFDIKNTGGAVGYLQDVKAEWIDPNGNVIATFGADSIIVDNDKINELSGGVDIKPGHVTKATLFLKQTSANTVDLKAGIIYKVKITQYYTSNFTFLNNNTTATMMLFFTLNSVDLSQLNITNNANKIAFVKVMLQKDNNAL